VIAVRRVAWRYFTADDLVFSDTTAAFSTPELADISWRRTDVRHVFSRKCCSAHRRTWPLDGLIWPQAGCASIA
jgi:hypothetical protein